MKNFYTFRHYRFVVSKKGSIAVDAKDCRNHLIEKELERGYFPINIKTEIIRGNAIRGGYPIISDSSIKPVREFFVSSCVSAYAGKKTARELWKKNSFLESPNTTRLLRKYKE